MLNHDYTDLDLQKPYGDKTERCKECEGHGYWVLKKHAYKLPQGIEDNRANRASYCHFKTLCSNCNGWGYLRKESVCTGSKNVHEWEFEKNLGNCHNRYRCKHCGQEWDIDSSG